MSRTRLAFGAGLFVLCTVAAVLLFRALGGVALAATLFGQRFELRSPELLAALAYLPLLPYGLASSLSDLPLPQRLMSFALRALLVATIALALARPARTHDASLVSAVVLADVSDSVTDADLAASAQAIRELYAARGPNSVELVTFAARPKRVPAPKEGAAFALARLATPREPEAGARTDLQAALQLAYGLFEPGRIKRIALLSDGLETHGDARAEAARAERLGVRAFYRALDRGKPPELAVRSLELPEAISVGESFAITAHVFAAQASHARLRLYQDQLLNGLDGVRDVELVPGDNAIRFQSVVRAAGEVHYKLELEPKGPDRFRENNAVTATALVPGRPSVLLVDSDPNQLRELAQALQVADFEVELRSATAVPRTLAELSRYDLFILSDVPADRFPPEAMDALERYVRDLGGGFAMLGGQRSFGLGGWNGTRMEQLLPVWMDSERRRDEHSLALSLVIDCSGSMSGQKIELAKDAAKAAAEALGPDDSLAVVGFSGEPERTVRMQSARNRLRIEQNIARITAQGGTAIFPALDMAFQDLLATTAKVKHVILLTDGQTQESGVVELVQAMRAEAITVSSVGLGTDVNRGLLQQAANVGGGRAYFTDDPHNVPRIFVRETTTVGQSSTVEDLVRVLPREPADFMKGIDLSALPLLRGYVAVREKSRPAQVLLQSELSDPILVRWRSGLGWVLAFASDLKPRWASEWLRWRELPTLLGQLAREHMRERRHDALPMRTQIDGDELVATVDAIGPDDRFIDDLQSSLTIDGPLQDRALRKQVSHTLRQRAPGLYEARVPLPGYGTYALRALHRRGDRVVAQSEAAFSYPYSPEYAALPADREMLAQIAQTTGGAELTRPAQLFARAGDRVVAHEELWPRLLLFALGLFLLDILLRRVRLWPSRAQAAR